MQIKTEHGTIGISNEVIAAVAGLGAAGYIVADERCHTGTPGVYRCV